MPIHGYPGNIITANPTAPTSSVASGVWTTEQQLIAKAAGNWPFTIPTQQISRSLRFSGAYPATPSYLSRTSGAPTNNIKWTFSFWAKRGVLGVGQHILNGGTGSSASEDYLSFLANDKLAFYQGNATTTVIATNAVFRDASAWYHVVLVYDSAQATSTNRLFIYVNNVSQSFSSTTYPTLNQSTNINANGVLQRISSRTYLADEGLDGYMTEMYFIDGQALTPSSFGQTNASTGVWEPIAYTGTYGNNGFYLNFSDNSGTTSTTLGKDYSGNGNNWTPNNFSVTAGAGNDSLVDTPTAYGTDTGVGGEVRGNYATWNPLLDWKTNGSAFTLSNGNLDVSEPSATTWGSVASTISMPSGKWYCEITATTVGAAQYTFVGITATTSAAGFPGQTATSYSYRANGNKLNNDATGSGVAYGASYASNDIIGIAFDADAGSLTFYKNGASQGTAYTGISAGSYYFVVGDYATTQSSAFTANFGQRAFAYTAPSGFKALCTQNLPTPTIGATSTTQANKYFDVTTFTGNASTNTIVNSGSMQPDMVWLKSRSNANNHTLYDAVRGVNIQLYPNLTNAEDSGTGLLTSFNSNGFTLGASQNSNDNNGESSVGWQWRASNTTAVTNTAGSITSTVSANTTSGFSIVTYTGTGANATVGHGIGTAPQMVIIKQRNGIATFWCVYHTSLASGFAVYLNSTLAAGSDPPTFNSTAPTSTVFSIGTSTATNTNGNTYVAYCFAPVAGYSAFGSYTGNGAADGPFVYLGFRPRYIMQKRTDSTGTWELYDTARDTYNVMSADLAANLSDAETSFARFDSLSNGFKIRTTGAATNASGGTYIYACFAENPFKYSLAR